ncbi:MAG: hypothetical protein IK102_00780 [Treponema sp.]|nr:hypothetical protein [Treponema sp.]
MKKLILGMLAAVVMTASVSAIEFSAGGEFGMVAQQYLNNDGAFSTLQGSPLFGIVGNADFGGWGVQVSFDINSKSREQFTKDVDTKKWKWNNSYLGLTPYFTFKLGELNIAAGPVLGVCFYSYSYEDTLVSGSKGTFKESCSYFIWGTNVEARQTITDNIRGYVSLPVIFLSSNERNYSSAINGEASPKNENYNKWTGLWNSVNFATKIGVVYVF